MRRPQPPGHHPTPLRRQQTRGVGLEEGGEDVTGETGSASRSPPDPTAERAKGGVGLEEGGEEVTGETGAGLSLQVTTRPHCGEGKHEVYARQMGAAGWTYLYLCNY